MSGDSSAWRRWRRLADSYFRRRVSDAEFVEDCVQESCMRAWLQQRRHGRELTPSLLFGICRRVLSESLRKQYRRSHVKELRFGADGIEPICPRAKHRHQIGTLEAPSLGVLLEELQDAIAELPVQYRGAIRDKSRGLPLRDIAQRHGWTLSAVRMRLFRGRRMLERKIRERIDDYENRQFRA